MFLVRRVSSEGSSDVYDDSIEANHSCQTFKALLTGNGVSFLRGEFRVRGVCTSPSAAACGMRLADAAHYSEVMIQCTIALCGFLDLEGRLAGWWFKCRAGTCTGGVGMLACLYRASWCSLPAMINNTACYYY